MKKWVCISILLLAGSFSLQTQTFAEWFKQRKTQIKYYLEQIAQLRVHVAQLKKGYALARDGLTTIEQWKKGEYSLHHRYFSSLKTVRPAIARFADVAQLVTQQIQAYKNYQRLLSAMIASGLFTPEEITLFYDAFVELMRQMLRTTEQAMQVITPQALQMTDDERLKRINLLREEAQTQQIHFYTMESSLWSAAAQRIQQKADVERMRKWYDIP